MIHQYNYPTTVLCGPGALQELAGRLEAGKHNHLLVVTDKTLKEIGLADRLTELLIEKKMAFSLFDETHPNPTEEDVENATAAYTTNQCDSIVALGGGSPMDVAKAVRIMAVHPRPLARYDDAKGGDRLITNPMPPLYAVPTTAGTGSEVGRSAVIIMRSTGKKSIFFHPDLMPDIAVLDPELTVGLPPAITAATGMDAFVHCLESYFAPGLHPMADGIALQGMELVLDWLPIAVKQGDNLVARERMLLAATMGATAFQKGLGMIHSLAHPLSSRFHIHHGLANALLLPAGVAFLEHAELNKRQARRIARVQSLFEQRGIDKTTLSEACLQFLVKLDIHYGLSTQGIKEEDLEALSKEAFEDPCHQSNMVPVQQPDLLEVYRAAL